MVHGRTRIKLYNALSGHTIKDIVSENTFQKGVIAEGVRNFGYARGSFYNNTDGSIVANPPVCEMIGGIFLFKEQITGTPSFLPLGNEMTGNGAWGVMNSSAPTELGSFDTASSFVSDNKVKQVYNYAASQANGKISCVCLTSRTGGYIGYGNPSGVTMANSQNRWAFERNAGCVDTLPQTNLLTIKSTTNKICCDGKLYTFAINGTNLDVNKIKVPLKYASIGDCVTKAFSVDISQLHYSWMGSNFILSASNKFIYITPSITVPKSGTFYIWKYDTSDDSITELEFNFGYEAINVSVAHGKVFAPVYGTDKSKIFNMDGTLFDEIEVGSLNASVYAGMDSIIGEIGNHALVNWHNAGETDSLFKLYDFRSKTLLPINTNVYGYNRTQGIRQDESSGAITYQFYAGATSSREMWAIPNPLYLATINNLDNAVIKDATMGMTVEYILEEV